MGEEFVSEKDQEIKQETEEPEEEQTTHRISLVEGQKAIKVPHDEIHEVRIVEMWESIVTLLKKRKEKLHDSQISMQLTTPESTSEDQSSLVDEELCALQLEGAIERRDVVEVQKKIIKIIEIITVWMEIIEYRIHKIKNVHMSAKDRNQEYQPICTEILIIEERLIILEKSSLKAKEFLPNDTKHMINNAIKDLREQFTELENMRSQTEEGQIPSAENSERPREKAVPLGEIVDESKISLSLSQELFPKPILSDNASPDDTHSS